MVVAVVLQQMRVELVILQAHLSQNLERTARSCHRARGRGVRRGRRGCRRGCCLRCWFAVPRLPLGCLAAALPSPPLLLPQLLLLLQRLLCSLDLRLKALLRLLAHLLPGRLLKSLAPPPLLAPGARGRGRGRRGGVS